MSAAAPKNEDGQVARVLLVSSRDWFVSALEAVLEPQGFRLLNIPAEEGTVDRIPEIDPDIVIVDEGEPALPAAELCRQCTAAGVRPSTPILVYSPNYWHEKEQAEAMEAGAWDVIREPIRSTLLTAKLNRLLDLRRLIESTEEGGFADPDTGLFSLAGLMFSLPIVASIAERSGVSLSCSVIGVSRLGKSSGEVESQRMATAALVRRYTRASDLCVAVSGSDVGLIAFDAGVDTAANIVRRLSERAEESAEFGPGGAPLSAGIADLPIASVFGRSGVGGAAGGLAVSRSAERVASLSRLAAAQTALQQARAARGGIRIADSGLESG